MALPDEELVSQAQAGSLAAFNELVARHQERVHALAYRILGNAEDAADIQQETFVRAWTKLGKFRQQAAFSTWLHRITVNLYSGKTLIAAKQKYGIPPLKNKEQLVKALEKTAGKQLAEQAKQQALKQSLGRFRACL
ncbi:MAG: sigma-70 family RNA polymerase sigma factor [Armatimonadota bacterium]|nr:sigma-70 family RNA polymerase sigma factor [Armatimonadota bacterium]